MITITQRGSFDKLINLLINARTNDYKHVLNRYAQQGVAALSAATPKDTGLTAGSWYYEIIEDASGVTINWKNSNVSTGVNVAMLLQYGHATKNGGYVEGIDYINPALAPVFDKLADSAWREMTGNGNSG